MAATKSPFLIVGDLSGEGWEILEIVEQLGYQPINVTRGDCTETNRCKQFALEALPSRLRSAPAVPIGLTVSPADRHERIDRRWTRAKQNLVQVAEEAGISNWTSLIHPSAEVSSLAVIGRGVIVLPLSSISSNVRIGDFTLVGRLSCIDHDSIVGEYSRIGAGVTIPGGVRLGSSVMVGIGSQFLNGARVADGVLIGAGSVVTRHIRKPHQVMGNPARPLRRPFALIKRGAKRLLKRLLYSTGLYERARAWYRKIFG